MSRQRVVVADLVEGEQVDALADGGEHERQQLGGEPGVDAAVDDGGAPGQCRLLDRAADLRRAGPWVKEFGNAEVGDVDTGAKVRQHRLEAATLAAVDQRVGLFGQNLVERGAQGGAARLPADQCTGVEAGLLLGKGLNTNQTHVVSAQHAADRVVADVADAADGDLELIRHGCSFARDGWLRGR